MGEQTPAQRADQIRRVYDARMCSREAAIREIRAVLNVTDLGAGEMLDHPMMPSVRYGSGVRPAACTCDHIGEPAFPHRAWCATQHEHPGPACAGLCEPVVDGDGA